ncbi:MFS transporter [Nonomuraea antimicrobica]
MTAVAAALIQYGSALKLAGLPLLAIGVVLLAVALPKLLLPGSLRAAPGLPTAPVLRGLAYGSLMAAEVLIPLMLMNERGLSATGAGIVLTIGALGWSTGSWIKGRGTIGNMAAVRGGAAMIAVGIAMVTLVLVDSMPLAVAYVAMAVAGLGIGALHPTVSVLVLKMSKEGEEGQNGAAVGVGESVFTVVAVAVSGALFTATGGSYLAGLVFTVVLAVVAFLLAPVLCRPPERALWRKSRHKRGDMPRVRELEVFRLVLPYGRRSESLLVKLTDHGGMTGWGEATAPGGRPGPSWRRAWRRC